MANPGEFRLIPDFGIGTFGTPSATVDAAQAFGGLGGNNMLAANFDALRNGFIDKETLASIENMALSAAAPEVAAAKVQTASDQKIATSVGDSVANYFVRAIVIILGFIFVAVGLSMFKVNVPIVGKIAP